MVGGNNFFERIIFLPQEIDIICDEHLTSEIKTLFNQTNAIVSVDIEKYGTLNKYTSQYGSAGIYCNDL